MSKKPSRKKSTYDFHLNNIRELKNDSDFLLKEIPNFNKEAFYTKKDKKGWWMVTKQILIRKYIGLYLNVFGTKKNRKDLIFIDILSSNGMNKVTKSNREDIFIFPGCSISAALISQRKNFDFIKFYCNDRKPENRKVLASRFKALNDSNKLKRKINYEIDLSNKRIDSNDWIMDIIDEINDKYGFKHCLIIIDNEGMDILFDVIKKIRNELKYADLIINLQSQSIARSIDTSKAERFFCRKPDEDLKREEILPFYKKCLEEIGYKSQEIKVSGHNFFYYLLFCHREEVSGKWMRMIKDYREERFRNWHDENVKQFWDIVAKKTKTMENFF
ncbi:MAG: hypothetical protein ACTSXH_15390 [Promethearchaeota archaeon]